MIKILDQNTIQKIAAGEVIERPSSVVKELFENSIDAGAKNIQVDIIKGGKELISLVDDGVGIKSDQVELAFKRHATSKIGDFDDLYSIYTMGFRGEALASIIAVAELDIRTKHRDEDIGSHIIFKNSQIINKSKVAMNTGTNIIVKNIFENIPVRKKFLKSDIVESNNITDIVSKLSISKADLSVKYSKDNKIIFQISDADSHVERIRKIFGNDMADSLVYIGGESDNFKVEGYVSNNTYFRGNRALQYLYVNNRYVESLNIAKTIEANYNHIIPNGKFPVYQIYISTKADNLDINIHPNKTKINLTYSNELLDLLNKLVKDVLKPEKLLNIEIKSSHKENNKLFLDLDDKYKNILDSYKAKGIKAESDEILKTDKNPVDIDSYNWQTQEDSSDDYSGDIVEEEIKFDTYIIPGLNKTAYRKEEEKENRDQYDYGKNSFQIEESKDKIRDIENYLYKSYIFKTYLLFENYKLENIVLMDQHAAHERINFEKLLRLYKDSSYHSQEILVPIELDLLESEVDILIDNMDFFEKFEFAINIEDNKAIIYRVPALDNIDYKAMFIDLLDGLPRYNNYKSEYLLEKIIQKACKSSIKAMDIISETEAMDLLHELNNCEYPLTCPHGRPTFVIINKREFDKEFKRIK